MSGRDGDDGAGADVDGEVGEGGRDHQRMAGGDDAGYGFGFGFGLGVCLVSVWVLTAGEPGCSRSRAAIFSLRSMRSPVQ